MNSPQTILNYEEKLRIIQHLKHSHALFRTFWDLGEPTFTDTLPTAAIQFDKNGEFMEFLFNPDFWSKLSTYDRAFVMCHEFLHVLYNHGKRINDVKSDHDVANKAMDICVNHSLINDFGFVRSKLTVEQVLGSPLCWIDTIFGDDWKEKKIQDNREAEYYYNLLIKNPPPPSKAIVLDGHMPAKDCSDVCNYVKGNAMQKLDDDLLIIIQQKSECPFSPAGVGEGAWAVIKDQPVKLLKKWETILNDWNILKWKDDLTTIETFVRKSRRFENILSDDFCLPSECTIEERFLDNDAIGIFMFLDTSGSCYHLKDKFFAAYKTFNKYKFQIRVFSFDTNVKEVDLKNNQIHGGGGTCFKVIERCIQKELKKNPKLKYPYVMVVTDGYGTVVTPQHPEKWFWFMTEQHGTHCVPNKSRVYQMSEFIG